MATRTLTQFSPKAPHQAFAIQWRVIRALIVREVLHRYGGKNLGFFWVIGEPMLLSFGVMGLWALTRATHAGSLGIPLFALTGYSHIQLWRHCVFGASHSIAESSWLLYHPNVQVLDVLIAKAMMSSIGIFASLVLGYSILFLVGIADAPRDPLLIVAAWCLDTIFCFSFALVIAGIVAFADFAGKLLHPIMYLTLPLTGSFTMLEWLPEKARSFLIWSPLVDACEMLRAGVFPEDVTTYWNPWIIVLSSLALLALGLPLHKYARRHIEVH